MVSAGTNLSNVRQWLSVCSYRLAELQPEKRRGMSAIYLASISTQKALDLIKQNAEASQALTRRMWHNKTERPILLDLAGLEEFQIHSINASYELAKAVTDKNWLRWHVLHFIREEQNRHVESINSVQSGDSSISLADVLAQRKAKLVNKP